MPNQAPNIIELLRRWLRGDARARDERLLEQRAANDEFLRDAIAGYDKFPESDHAAATARLQERLRRRNARRGGVIPLWMLKAAAAIALLAIGSVIWLFLWNDAQGDQAFARKEEAAAEAIGSTDSALADNSLIQEPPPPGPVAPRAAKEETRPASGGDGPSPPQQEPASTALAVDSRAAPETAEDNSAGAGSPAPDKPLALDYPIATVEEDSAPAAGFATAPRAALRTARGGAVRSLPADTSTHLIQGHILTPSGEPLIGATITFPGTSQGAVTDLEGAFSVQAPAGQESFTVSYAGYQTVRIPINRQDSFRITLPEEAALSEVVVTDLNRAKRRDRGIAVPKTSIASLEASPE